jgi:hypothetical protein
LLHLSQRITLVDADLDLAAAHGFEQVVGHGLRDLARDDVGEQRLARHVDRSLGRQQSYRKRRRRAGSGAEAGHEAERLQAVERLVPGVLADRVVHDLHAAPACDVLDAGQEVFLRVVDDVGRTVLLGQRAFGVRARRAYELQAHGARPLTGNQSDAAGGRVEKHEVTLLQAALGLGPLEQVLRREALEHHGRAGVEVDSIGQLAHALGRHHAQFAITAGRLAGIGGAVTGLEVGDTLTHRLDHSRGLHAQRRRHRQRVQAGAVIDVDKVQSDAVVPDAYFAGARFAHAHVGDLQLFRAARLLDSYCFAHDVLAKVRRASCHETASLAQGRGRATL